MLKPACPRSFLELAGTKLRHFPGLGDDPGTGRPHLPHPSLLADSLLSVNAAGGGLWQKDQGLPNELRWEMCRPPRLAGVPMISSLAQPRSPPQRHRRLFASSELLPILFRDSDMP